MVANVNFEIFARNEMSDLDRARMFRVVRNGRKVPISEVYSEDTVDRNPLDTPELRRARVEALAAFYASHAGEIDDCGE
jgi:hypothetical protein